MNEFALDFTAPFNRDAFLSYLKLSEDERFTVRKAAEDEFAKLKGSIRELDKSTFRKVCDSLPKSSKDKMLELFSLVWLGCRILWATRRGASRNYGH